jgi:hypothetical protein
MSKQMQPQIQVNNGPWVNVGRTYTTIGAANSYLHKYLSGRRNVTDSRIVNVQTGTAFDFNRNREWHA